jgi:hypothetical protein
MSKQRMQKTSSAKLKKITSPSASSVETTKCPYCGEEIYAVAVKCKHCGEILKRDEYLSIVGKSNETSDYYSNVFKRIENDEAKFIWNWAAFLFCPGWYFYRGMWMKGLILLGLQLITVGLFALPVWIFGGLVGNWDYYLYKTKGKTIWSWEELGGKIKGTGNRVKRKF